MKVTVIIPVFNRPEHLPLAVASILMQKDAANLDVLIVDDGSTDETPNVIAKLVEEAPSVRSVRCENGGVAAARNIGLENIAPDADIITFVDSDDTLIADRLRLDLNVLKENPDVEITYGDIVATNAIDSKTLAPPPSAVTSEMTLIHLGSGLYRRSLIDRVGRFDPFFRYAEDTDYLLRIFESGTKFIQTSTKCLYYLKHAGGLTQDMDAVNRYLAIAVLKSIKRRKDNPSLRLDKPTFNIEFPENLA